MSGFSGFDECMGSRMWTKEEMGVLSVLSRMPAIFLQRKRAADREQQSSLRLNIVLDTLDAYVCAIDRNTYELLYLKRKTRKLNPAV